MRTEEYAAGRADSVGAVPPRMWEMPGRAMWWIAPHRRRAGIPDGRGQRDGTPESRRGLAPALL